MLEPGCGQSGSNPAATLYGDIPVEMYGITPVHTKSTASAGDAAPI